MADYEKLLNQLKNGEIKELKITPEEFVKFQPILMNFSDRKAVVGNADRLGVIIYHYQNNESGND